MKCPACKGDGWTVVIDHEAECYAAGSCIGRAVASKFNEVSERVGFPERLPAPPPTSGTDS